MGAADAGEIAKADNNSSGAKYIALMESSFYTLT
jgi:hypothetical protein